MRIGSLFSGYGGLDLGVQAALGGSVAWHSEVDKDANLILEHRFPGVPNLGDITAVDWAAVEPVDVLTGGFPCQDLSHAGKRAGLRPGTRSGLWSHMAYAVEVLRPSLVVAENVRGLLSADARSQPNDERCVCGGALGWRGLDRPGDQQGLLPGAGDSRHDTACPPDALRPCGEVGRVRQPDPGGYGEVGRSLGVDGGGHSGKRVAGGGTPSPEDQSQAGDPGIRGGEVASGVASEAEWQRGMEYGDAHTLRPDQGRVASAQRERPETCLACGRVEGAQDSDLESCPWCVGDEREPALRALGAVLGDLADVGYDAAWCGLRAADVGAPHGRFRVFLVAWPAADADDDGRARGPQLDSGPLPRLDGEHRGHPDRLGVETRGVDWGAYAAAVARWERILGRPAPAPTEPGASGQPRLSPRFVEWMMGLPDGWVCDVPISRNAQLKALGNGVVPQQAEAALRWLLGGQVVGAAGEEFAQLLPTPQAHDKQGPKTPEQVAAMRAKGHGVRNLNEEVTLLPTPAVNDMGAGKTPADWDAWTDAMKARHGNGNGHGPSLAIEAQRIGGTP